MCGKQHIDRSRKALATVKKSVAFGGMAMEVPRVACWLVEGTTTRSAYGICVARDERREQLEVAGTLVAVQERMAGLGTLHCGNSTSTPRPLKR